MSSELLKLSTFFFFRYYANRIKVGVGNTNLTAIKEKYEVEKIVIHQNYSMGNDYNLSLLKLKKPLKFSKTVKKIKIGSETPKNNTIAVITGWGSEKPSSVSIKFITVFFNIASFAKFYCIK